MQKGTSLHFEKYAISPRSSSVLKQNTASKTLHLQKGQEIKSYLRNSKGCEFYKKKIKCTAFTNKVLGNNPYYRILPPCTTNDSDFPLAFHSQGWNTLPSPDFEPAVPHRPPEQRHRLTFTHCRTLRSAQPWQRQLGGGHPRPAPAQYQAPTLLVPTAPWGNLCPSDILCKAHLQTTKTPQSAGKQSKAARLRTSPWFW